MASVFAFLTEFLFPEQGFENPLKIKNFLPVEHHVTLERLM